MSSARERVNQVCSTLQDIAPFPISTFVEQLHHHVRAVPEITFIESGLGPLLAQEKIINGSNMTSNTANELMTTLAQASTASSVARLDETQDPFKFRECIDFVRILEMNQGWERRAISRTDRLFRVWPDAT